MLPGPVFTNELLITSRRGRYYWARSGFGLVMLAVVAQSFQGRFPRTPGGIPAASIRQMAEFGRDLFESLAAWQFAGVLLMTPALVAGCVADESQRKTLHYLLASCLSGGEIVLGKLAARLMMMIVLITVGLPILSLLGLFGGVDPKRVAWGYAGTISTVLALSGLAILVSVHARRVRDAILLTYALEAAILLGPLFAMGMKAEWPILYGAVEPINDWLLVVNPFWTFFQGNPRGLPFELAMPSMLGLHFAAFLATTGLAVLRLRPHFRNEGSGFRRFLSGRIPATRPTRGWALFGRPECGEEPMLWKERHVARLRGPTKVILGFLGLVVLSLVAYGTWRLGLEAWTSLAADRFDLIAISGPRNGFNEFLRMVGVLLYVITGLGVAVASASSLTSEKEEDTWITLTSTTLSGREILAAKMIGSLWALRRPVAVILAMWAVGVATGSLHPVGFVLAATQMGCYLGFIAALGTTVSLQARSTGRALAATLGILIFLNGGYLIALFLFQPEGILVALGFSPMILGMSLFSYPELWSILGWSESRWFLFTSEKELPQTVATLLLSPILYGSAGLALASWTVHRFDVLVDRPRSVH
ncbi:MAG: ABC transporter permease subunit [Isosphaeraceae bacterium]